jgi:DNA-binding LacI/PurR family transcriptional regulator
MKPYCKYSDILLSLKGIVSENIAKGELILPGERELAVKTGASRMTLRKALIELEKEKTVYRDKNSTRITPPSRKKGKFVFVAAMRPDTETFIFYAYERLWKHISKMALAQGFEIRLFMYHNEDHYFNGGSVPKALNGADGIFVSLIEGEYKNDFFKGINAITPNVFATDITMDEYCPNMICLDNFAAGEMAANEIIRSGYKKAACLGYRRPEAFIPFELRSDGFANAMGKSGTEHEIIWEKIKNLGEYPEKAKKMIKKLLAAGFDALFLPTDEWLDFILLDAIYAKVIPSRLGIITLDGSNTGLRMLPSLSCVSHGSKPVAAAIVEVMNRISRKKLDLPVRKLIKPEIYKGKSLR